jgi:small-conductance mechanosensitive channel
MTERHKVKLYFYEAPTVRFLSFGESGLDIQLLVWSTSLIHRRGLLVSNLNFAIYEAFAGHGIEIPFPQRVLHMRERPTT